MELIKRIYKKAFLVLIPLALLSALLEWKKLPLSVIVGGVLCLANIRGLEWGVTGLLGTGKATGRMIFFSMFRLFLLFAILSLLIYLRLVNVFGVLAGFTVIFALLLIEGLKVAKKADDQPG
ncbi:MAG TPA: hypothetical protein VLD55_06770 [Candidatus Sulfobium mesophilum]|nr:hypothetical protein [Candidatus Sulfobium mesophilum]